MEGIKNFFKSSWVQWGMALAAIGGVAAYIFHANDFSRPPVPDPNVPRDYNPDLDKLDPSKPIGVFIFNVDHTKNTVQNLTTPAVHASRNNYIEKMREHYGDNVVVIDNPGKGHLTQFANDFNAKFGASKPELHFVANHHQDTYDDAKLASFLASFESKSKRALILSCGPVSSAYENSGCDYVAIPRPDGQLLGPEVDLKISPAYRDAIGWLHDCPDGASIQAKFNENNVENTVHAIRDRAVNTMADLVQLKAPRDYKAPIVVVLQAGLPKLPAIEPGMQVK
jgi:hypothetical protein